ncbi:sporulation protein [Variovorax sp.]|uniref:sporulation protein n=1 Tax=Variovorax sp. TaxID=1871043 RepID=UPI002D2F5F3E|nr:sporulation protein [Variovorax sp.]HYP82864.1 sporulation protein [Variovorax sp.]
MLRLLFVVLLLANGLYFAWSEGALAAFGYVPASLTEREPQRMSQQIRPQALVIRPAPAPSAPAPVRNGQ